MFLENSIAAILVDSKVIILDSQVPSTTELLKPSTLHLEAVQLMYPPRNNTNSENEATHENRSGQPS